MKSRSEITEAVCERFNVTGGELAGKTRPARIARARMIAMAIMRRAGFGTVETGAEFGRDHTTASYAVKKVREWEQGDHALADFIRATAGDDSEETDHPAPCRPSTPLSSPALAKVAEMFPACETMFMPQRSEDWFAARKGVLTASQCGTWILNKTKKAFIDREMAIGGILENISGFASSPKKETEAMARGTALEPLAVEYYSRKSGQEVTQVGFCRSTMGRFGCSPDGLIVAKGIGFEGKAPEPRKHFFNFRNPNEFRKEHLMQVQFSMAVTGAKGWVLQSFCPGQPSVVIEVERDQSTDDLFAALVTFSAQLDDAIDRMREAWEHEFEDR